MKKITFPFLTVFCALLSFSVFAGGEPTKIQGTDKLISVLKSFHVPKGYILLDKCRSDDGKPLPGFIHAVSLNFNEHVVGEERGSVKVDNAFDTIVHLNEISEIPLQPSHPPHPDGNVPQIPLTPATPIAGENVAVHGIRSVVFHKSEGHADVKIQFYTLQGQLIWAKELSCPWDGAMDIVYHP